jgi:hypothetical protein
MLPPMRLRSLALLAAATLSLAACVTTAKERYLEEGYRLLSGAEIVQLVSDHTVEGRYGATGRAFVDYFAPDGRISTIEPGNLRLIGSWSVDGDLLCFTYPTGEGVFPKCVEVAGKDGHYVELWMREPRVGALGAELTNITPGNVNILPLE